MCRFEPKSARWLHAPFTPLNLAFTFLRQKTRVFPWRHPTIPNAFGGPSRPPPFFCVAFRRAICWFAQAGAFPLAPNLIDGPGMALILGSSAVEQSTVNRLVVGSNPTRGAIALIFYVIFQELAPKPPGKIGHVPSHVPFSAASKREQMRTWACRYPQVWAMRITLCLNFNHRRKT